MNGETKDVLKKSNEAQGFMVALIAAGDGGCTCKACQILKKLKDKMVEDYAGTGKTEGTA